jgi:hypothetical protein
MRFAVLVSLLLVVLPSSLARAVPEGCAKFGETDPQQSRERQRAGAPQGPMRRCASTRSLTLAALSAASPGFTAQGKAPGTSVEELARRAAENEKKCREARDHYTYRQTFEFTEYGGGSYVAVTDVTFTPEGKRIEKPVRKPINSLSKLRMTEEDLRDLTEVQPLLLEPEDLWNYEVTYMEEAELNAIRTHVLRVHPRQIFDSQRLFDGIVWVTAEGLEIIQAEGKAVPDLVKNGRENLFARFTTFRERIDGVHWFPARTVADDVLQFRTGPVRVHFVIKYENYKRFGADIKIEYPPK